MPRKGFLENFGYQNLWDPGIISSPATKEGLGKRWYQYAQASNLLFFCNPNTAGVTVKIVLDYSLLGSTWTQFYEGESWVPVAGKFYLARIHRDLLPKEVTQDSFLSHQNIQTGAFVRYGIELTGGTSINQFAVEIFEQLIEMPSRGQPGDPTSKGKGLHFDYAGTGRLQQDSNGVDLVRFDLTP